MYSTHIPKSFSLALQQVKVITTQPAPVDGELEDNIVQVYIFLYIWILYKLSQARRIDRKVCLLLREGVQIGWNFIFPRYQLLRILILIIHT